MDSHLKAKVLVLTLRKSREIVSLLNECAYVRWQCKVIALKELTISEREVLRYAFRLNHPLRLEDACYCLQMRPQATRQVLLKLVEKKLIRPLNKGTKRFHQYALEEKATIYML
jgi:hypothetical protein